MIVHFKHKGLQAFFLKGNSSKINASHASKLRLILAKLHAAHDIKDVGFPGSRLHALSGDLKDYWSISVSGSWRIIFRFEKSEVSHVDYLDYH